MTAPSPQEPAPTRSLASLSLLSLVTLAVFWPTLSGDFVYDDLLLVKDNTLIRSLANLDDAFARPYWEGLDPDGTGVVGLWRPLATVALMIGQLIGGGGPLGFHVVSVLVHLGAAVLAMQLARRLTANNFIALWTGILFALHPVHMESVAWISGISDPLAGLFVLLTLNEFERDRADGTAISWRTGLWFLLGLLAKESALAVIPMMAVLDLRPGTPKKALMERARGYFPVLGAFALYTAARMFVFGELTAGYLTVTTEFGVPASRLWTLRLELLGGFMQLLFWPFDLALFRPFQPEFAAGDATLWIAAAWSVACLGLAVFLIKKKNSIGAAAWILIPASLLPLVLRVSALGVFPLADRYLYLAVFGFSLAVAMFAGKRLPMPAATAALTLLAGVYAWVDVTRAADWQDEITLFERAAEQSPKSPYLAWERGRVYLTRYQEQKDTEDLKTAHAEYARGMELLADAAKRDQTIFATKRDHLEMNLGLAWCFLFEGELDLFRDFNTPRTIFESTIQKYPESSNAHVGLGIALMMTAEKVDEDKRGEIYLKAGEEIRKAIQISETDEARNAMGQLLLRLGDPEKAVVEFERALELRPDHLAYMLYLVQALEFLDDDARIRKTLDRAHELYPDAADPMRMLGSLAVRQHRASDALRWFERAIEQDEGDGYAHLQRGMVLAQLGNNKEAVKSLIRACELAPTEFEPHYNAAVLLLKSDTPQEAREFLFKAYVLRPGGSGNGPGSIGDLLSTELRKLSPKDPNVLWQLAEADRRIGETESALDWVNRSIQLEPRHGASLYTRAMILKADEATRDIAIADLEEAVKLLPGNFDVENELGLLLAETDRKKEAIEHLIAALQILPQVPAPEEEKTELHRAISHKLHTVQAAIEASAEN